MLQTQISYWANKEQMRHNQATERQNLIDLERREKELEQTVRYQTDQVKIAKRNLAEVKRHNLAQESLGLQQNVNAERQAEAALKQAQAALSQSETAYLNAQTNVTNAGTKAKEARIKAAQAHYGNLLNIQKSKESYAQTGLTRKTNKWYTTKNIAVPILTSITHGVTSGIAKAILRK